VLGRRLLVLAAVLLGLAAVTTSLAPRQATTSDQSARQPAQLEPRSTDRPSNVDATDDVPSEPPLMTLEARRSRQRVEVETGERVRLAISSAELGSVQIGADGPIEAIDPDSPARFDLLYETPAQLEIVVRDAANDAPRSIGRLDVISAP
jgi:hypothetical protein